MLRCIVYTRESDPKMKNEQSYQIEELPKLAKRRSWRIIPHNGLDVFDEGFVPATTLDRRPILREILEKANRREFDILLIKQEYRLARSEKMKDIADIVDTFRDNQIKVAIEDGKIYDLDDYRDYSQFIRQLLAGRDDNKEREIKVMRGMKAGVKKGRYQGTRFVNYGYKYDKWQPPECRRLEIFAEEAKVIEVMWTLGLNGHTSGQTSKILYERGYRSRSGGRFHTKFILDVWKNPVYTGTLVWNKRHYDKSQRTRKHYKFVNNPESEWIKCENAHDAIISKEDFQRMRDILKARRRTSQKVMGKYEYPFASIVKCDKCMNNYHGTSNISNHKTKTRKRWYKCGGPQAYQNGCKNKPMKAEDIEPQIFGIVEAICEHKDIRNRRFNNLMKRVAIDDDRDAIERLNSIEGKIKEITEEQTRLTRSRMKGTTPEKIYEQLMRESKKQMNDLRSEKMKIEASLVQKENSREYQNLLKTVIDNFDKTRRSLLILDKKELMHLMFKRISVDNGMIADVVMYQPFEKMLEEINTPWRVEKVHKEVKRRSRDVVSTYALSDVR